MDDQERIPPPPAQVSRRDFLRRAGSEAATTATQLPGVGLAAKALGVAPTPAGPPAPSVADWWQRLIRRRERRQPEAAPQEEKKDG